MNKEDKIDVLKAIAQSVNMDRTQFVLVLESGNTICYNNHEPKPEEKTHTSQHVNDVIMEYVGRLMPVVREEVADKYIMIWQEILANNMVKQVIYNKGKQQDTSFNRNLVAQIIHQISPKVYLSEAKPTVLAEYLEPEKGANHAVRQKLGEAPENVIKKEIDKCMEKYV